VLLSLDVRAVGYQQLAVTDAEHGGRGRPCRRLFDTQALAPCRDVQAHGRHGAGVLGAEVGVDRGRGGAWLI
jgi:hypothetical protein